MAKHERGCTNNPNRACGLCATAEEVQPALSHMLPAYRAGGLDALRKAANNCPACILATLRQTDHHLRDNADWFDYRKEADAWWSDLNDATAEAECWRHCT